MTVRVVLRYWPSTMAKRRRRLVLAVVALAVLAILALLILFTGRPTSRLPFPDPNGYDDFIKASEAIVGDAADWSALDHGGLYIDLGAQVPGMVLLRPTVGAGERPAPTRLILSPMGGGRIAVGVIESS